MFTAFSPAISDFGRTAFTGVYATEPNCYSCLGYAVFGPGGVVAKTGDTISGLTFTNSIFPVGINDECVVLMQANFLNGYGLFTKDSVVAATGDILGGFQVSGFLNSQINECGDVGFSTFEDIVLAKHKKSHERHK